MQVTIKEPARFNHLVSANIFLPKISDGVESVSNVVKAPHKTEKIPIKYFPDRDCWLNILPKSFMRNCVCW